MTINKLLLCLLLSFLSFGVYSQIIHVSEDFNAATLPTGWTTTAVSGSQTWSFGSIGTATNLNGTSMAFFDDDALGATSLNNTSDLLSPSFDNSTLNKTFLEFDYNFYQFGPVADSFMVDVFDGSNWIRVFSRGTDDCGRWNGAICNNGFPNALIDISSFANANCQVRFRYFDGNDWAFSAGIDNVEIYSLPKYNLELSAILSPTNSCGLSAAESAQIEIRNIGTDSVQNFRVFMDVNQGAQLITDTLPIAIAPDSTYIHTFTNSLNLSAVASYNLKAYLRSSQDSVKSNDSLLLTISNDTIYSGNYFENFETANHGWTVSGTNASWAWGTPNTTNINRAFSGTGAFVTNLSGNYNNSELSYLSSPCFDLTNFNNTPIVSFRLKHLTESFFDYLWLEYSTNNGGNWSKVVADTTQFANNWYNNTSLNAWTGINNQWLLVENLLRNLANSPSVKFRFVFQSDNSIILEGAAIDDFGINELSTVDLALRNMISGPNSCGLGIEPIHFEAQNRGTTPIDTIWSFYQINGGAIVRDTIVQRLNPGQIDILQTNSTFNFFNSGNYLVKLWVDYPNDTISINDTLFSDTIVGGINVSYTAPYFEDFNSNFTAGPFNTPGILGNGWKRTSTSPGNNGQGAGTFYSWWVNDTQTGSFATGPISGIGGVGNYLHLEASYSLGEAILESPCIYVDSSIANPYLNFYYHRYGDNSMSDLYVDIFSYNQWIPLDTLSGITHSSEVDPFLLRSIDISKYNNQIVKIRFRGIARGGGFRGDVAIDNVSITDGKMNSIQLISTTAQGDNCNLSRRYPIQLSLKLNSDTFLLPNTISTNYSLNGVNSPLEFIPDTLFSDSIYNYTFQSIGDFSAGGLFELKTIINYSEDNFPKDDTSTTTVKSVATTLPYFEGFEESFKKGREDECGIIRMSKNFSENNIVALPGYEYDFNDSLISWGLGFDTSSLCGRLAFNGDRFLRFNGNTGSFPSTEIAYFKLPCFDLNNYNKVNLSFAYLKNNLAPTLYIEVESNNNIVKIDSIVPNTTNVYSLDTISLDSFIGDTISVRFSFIANTLIPTVLLDDIRIYDPTVVGISDNEIEKSGLLLYPNPNNGSFQIEIGEDLIGQEYQLFNISGQEIRSGKFVERNEALDISNEKAGIYFLQVPNKGINKKVVVY